MSVSSVIHVHLSILQARNNDQVSSNDLSPVSNIPKSPRCLAIMNARQRRDRLSTLIALPSHKFCQTDVTALKDSAQTIQSEAISTGSMKPTNDSSKIDRQIQVNTLPADVYKRTQAQIDISERLEKDSMVNLMHQTRILTALTDKDGSKYTTPFDIGDLYLCVGQRWPQFIHQLLHEPSLRSPGEIAQRLLDQVNQRISWDVSDQSLIS